MFLYFSPWYPGYPDKSKEFKEKVYASLVNNHVIHPEIDVQRIPSLRLPIIITTEIIFSKNLTLDNKERVRASFDGYNIVDCPIGYHDYFNPEWSVSQCLEKGLEILQDNSCACSLESKIGFFVAVERLHRFIQDICIPNRIESCSDICASEGNALFVSMIISDEKEETIIEFKCEKISRSYFEKIIYESDNFFNNRISESLANNILNRKRISQAEQDVLRDVLDVILKDFNTSSCGLETILTYSNNTSVRFDRIVECPVDFPDFSQLTKEDLDGFGYHTGFMGRGKSVKLIYYDNVRYGYWHQNNMHDYWMRHNTYISHSAIILFPTYELKRRFCTLLGTECYRYLDIKKGNDFSIQKKKLDSIFHLKWESRKEEYTEEEYYPE